MMGPPFEMILRLKIEATLLEIQVTKQNKKQLRFGGLAINNFNTLRVFQALDP